MNITFANGRENKCYDILVIGINKHNYKNI